MSDEMECMCQECGISVHLSQDLISMEEPANPEAKLLAGIHACPECGGRLVLRGKVGEEPHYKLK
jgi:hypothetical protein